MSASSGEPTHPAPPTPPCKRRSPGARSARRGRRPAPREWWPLFHLLDHGFEMLRHRRNRLTRQLHLTAGSLGQYEIEASECRILVRKVIAKVAAAALLSLERRPRHRFRHGEQILEVECRVPTGIVLAVPRYADARRPAFERFDPRHRALHLRRLAHDADEVLHRLLQRLLHLIRSLGGRRALEWRERLAGRTVDLARVDRDDGILLR